MTTNPTSIKFAIEQAIKNNKPTVTVAGKKIKVPSPQTSGTYGQQAAYASQAADKLMEKHFKRYL